MVAYAHPRQRCNKRRVRMRLFTSVLLACAVITTAAAQAPEIPLGETRLTVHTLLREDIFAGFLSNNMERMARGERNIDALLQQRPDERANLLAWKSAAAVYHAVVAHEAGKSDEFERAFKQARDTFAEAAALTSGNGGVPAIIGGTYSVFADRLP